MTAPLFLVPLGSLDRPGGSYRLDGPEGRHAADVQRLRVGEEVLLADGEGALARCTVRAAEKGALDLAISSLEHVPEPSPRLVLVQALAKGDRDLMAVESATELDVDEVVPWQADRSIVRWKGPKVDKGLAKWAKVIERAAKQSRRGRWPQLEGLVTSASLAQRCSGATVLVLHEDATAPLATADLPDQGEVLLVVGPEGGISPEELERLVAAGATPVRLGPQVLRASTAGPAALAVVNAMDRWR